MVIQDSHYGREFVPSGVKFLPSDLNINLCHKLFNETQTTEKITYHTFYIIFIHHNKFKFQQLKVDICQTCDFFLNSLKSARGVSRDTLKSQLITHQNTAKRFYEQIRLLKTENKVAIAFDLQKQLPLPKHNSSPIYYLPNIWLYNLGFVSSTRERDISSIYQWTELQINKSPV